MRAGAGGGSERRGEVVLVEEVIWVVVGMEVVLVVMAVGRCGGRLFWSADAGGVGAGRRASTRGLRQRAVASPGDASTYCVGCVCCGRGNEAELEAMTRESARASLDVS